MADSVKVAVRVRPFNQREKDKNDILIVSMPEDEPGKVILRDPASDPDKPKLNEFTFDFAYWSHDKSRTFDTQDRVFQDMGAHMLDKSFDGFNFTLFAYGQTGAGKSYSMMGAGDINGSEAGIIPRFCRDLFQKVAEKRVDPANTTEYMTKASYLEIYNEKIRDLLNPVPDPKKPLEIRESKEEGIHVNFLTAVEVFSYADVNRALETGNRNRTIGSTAMNAVSSRSHSVFTIQFIQKKTNAGMNKASEVKSKINLVDLAGSERADSTGATGERLKEGCAINKSLSALGNVISALAKNSNPKLKKKEMVPYRNSVLTRLLQESLGGNSITTMIAALSPAGCNYDETLSTLRYADRAKQIKNAAKRNESPTDKVIRELKEQVEALKRQLTQSGITPIIGGVPVPGASTSTGGAGGIPTLTEAERQELQAQLEAKQREIEENNMSWEERLKKAIEEEKLRNEALMKSRIYGSTSGDEKTNEALSHPHFTNLNEDPLMSETLVFDLRDKAVFGKDSSKCDITFGGNGIESVHMMVCLMGRKELGKLKDNSTGVEKTYYSDVYRLFVFNNFETYVNGEFFKDYIDRQIEKRENQKGNNGNGASDYETKSILPIPGKEEINVELKDRDDYVELTHGMRIILGSGTYLKYIDPDMVKFLNEQAISKGTLYKQPMIDYEYAKHERARVKMGYLNEGDIDDTDETIEKKMQELEERFEKKLNAELAAIQEGTLVKSPEMVKESIQKNKRFLKQEAKRMQIEAKDKRMLVALYLDLMDPLSRADYYMAMFEKDVYFNIKVKNRVENKFIDHMSINVNLNSIFIAITKKTQNAKGGNELTVSYLTPDEFNSLFAKMEEIYEQLILMKNEGATKEDLEEAEKEYWGDSDPFVTKTAYLVGASCLVLLPFLYCLNDALDCPLVQAKDGKEKGHVSVQFGIMTKEGKICEDDILVSGQEYILFVEVLRITGIPPNLRSNVKVVVKFNGLLKTYICPDSDSQFDTLDSFVEVRYRAEFPLLMDDSMREYLESGMLLVEVYGCQPPVSRKWSRHKKSSSKKKGENNDQEVQLSALTPISLGDTK